MNRIYNTLLILFCCSSCSTPVRGRIASRDLANIGQAIEEYRHIFQSLPERLDLLVRNKKGLVFLSYPETSGVNGRDRLERIYYRIEGGKYFLRDPGNDMKLGTVDDVVFNADSSR